MEIRGYLEVLWRRKWVVLIALSVTTAIVMVGSQRATPTYAATATIRVSPAAGAEFTYADYVFGERFRNTYVRLITSKPVLEQVRAHLGADAPATIKRIAATPIQDTELIELRVEDTNPASTALVANALAEVLVSQGPLSASPSEDSARSILADELKRIEKELVQLQTEYDWARKQTPTDAESISTLAASIQLKRDLQATLLERSEKARAAEIGGGNVVTIIERANPPTSPAQSRRALTLTAAAAAGLLAGLMLAFLFENVDTTLHTLAELEAACDAPFLGLVAEGQARRGTAPAAGPAGWRWVQPVLDVVRRAVGRGQARAIAPGPSATEEAVGRPPIHPAFRRLRTTLASVADRGARVFLVTSVDSVTSSANVIQNLAFLMGEAEQQVVVVEADSQTLSLQGLFDLANPPAPAATTQDSASGTNLQDSDKDGWYSLRDTGVPRVRLVTFQRSKDGVWTQPELDRARTLIESLATQGVTLLINAPPVLTAPEFSLLSPSVDGVLIVVRLGRTTSERLRQTLAQLATVGAKVTGVIGIASRVR